MLDSEDIGSNDSANPHIQDLIDARLSRRRMLGGTLATAAAGFIGAKFIAPERAQAQQGRRACKLGFSEVPVSTEDEVVVPAGYTWDVLIPWGTPLLPGAPAFAEDASNTAADQERQIGFNHDGMHYFPFPLLGNWRGVLVLNHEYTDANQIYTATQGSAITPDAAGREKVAKALAGHGVSAVVIQKKLDGTWTHVQGGAFNRRITGTTPMGILGTGPSRSPSARVDDHTASARNAEQLRAWRHAVGHVPRVRRELERLFRND